MTRRGRMRATLRVGWRPLVTDFLARREGGPYKSGKKISRAGIARSGQAKEV